MLQIALCNKRKMPNIVKGTTALVKTPAKATDSGQSLYLYHT